MSWNKYFLFLIFYTVFSLKVNSQCFNLNYSSCIVFGDTTDLSADNGLSGFWTITDPNGNVLTPSFPLNYYNNYNLVFDQIGIYTIEIDQSNTSPTCGVEIFYVESFSNSLSVVSLPMNNLCEGQTVDLSSFINVTNLSVYPVNYNFYLNQSLINNWESYVLDSGNSYIEVVVNDGSNCSDTTYLSFSATSNAISPPVIIIQDIDSNQNIIKPCGSTSLDFNVLNADSAFDYSWNIQGNNYLGSSITQSVNAPNTNPGNIEAILSIYDSISGCTVDFIRNISSVGLGDQIGAGLQTDIVPLCAGNVNLLWVENGSNAILEMGPGDTISWEISCGSIVIDTNTWSYHDLPNYLTTHPFINNEQVAGFPANFPYNSCGCNDPANGTTDQFKIKAELTSACLSNSVTIATWKTVNDPLQAEFTAEDVCVGDSTLFINNSTSGCDGNTFDSNEDTLRYYWNFGDCSSIEEVISIANSGNEYPNISHLYSNPGIYTVQLVTESYCGTDTVSYPITVRPKPVLDITGTDVCLNDTTKFFANAAPASDTIITYICQGLNLDIPILGGDSLFSYNWSMVDSVDGIYVNGTSSLSANPEFVFYSCGVQLVTLSMNDSTDCQIIDSTYVTVFDLPTAILSSPSQNEFFCTGDALNIIDNSNTISSCPTNSIDTFTIKISENFGLFNNIYIQNFSSSPNISEVIATQCDPNSAYNFNYNVTLIVQDDFGCYDSVSTIVTAICDTVTSNAVSCLTYDWNGQIIDSSGTYYQSFVNSSLGCDSIHALNVLIYSPDTVFSNVSSCNFYNWNGQIIDTNGTYTQTFLNYGGCDSVVFLNVNINYSDTSIEYVTTCDSYTWVNGITYTNSNDTSSYTYQTTNGCDSIVQLDLTILSSSNNASYTYHDTFDFTGSHQLFIVPPSVYNVNIQLYGAEGGGRLLSNNTSSGYGGAGAYATGNLAVNPSDTLYIYVGGHGESSTYGPAAGGWNGGGSGHASSAGEPGNGGGGASDVRYGDTTLNHRVIVASGGGGGGEDSGDQYSSGCGLEGISPNNYRTGSQTSGGSGTGIGIGSFGIGGSTDRADGGGGGGGYYGGGTFSSSSIGYDSQGGGGGSSYVGGVTDSSMSVWYPATNAIRSGHGQAILTYDLPTFGYIDTIAACNSYTWIDGVTYTSDNNTSTYTLTNAVGCDSTILLNLTIHTYDSIVSNINACDSFSLNGITYDSSGTYVYYGINTHGCDSTFILNLIMNQSNDSYTTITSCDSLLWNDSVYTESGIYTYNGIYDFFQLGQDINGENSYDYSGRSVSLSADGNRVAIGAYQNDGNSTNSGHVRIYENNNGSWTQLGQDIDGEASYDYSGHSVSLSSDGNRVAIGAYQNDGNGSNSGHVRIYENNNGSWSQLGQDIDGEYSNDYSGYSVSLSSDGNRVVIGAYGNDGNGTDAGHVRIYENNNGSWSQLGQDIDGEYSSDYSGYSVSLSSDGNIVAIGAYGNDGNNNQSGHVRIYENNNGSWTQLGQDIDGEANYNYSGWSVSLSSDGNRVAIGAYQNDGNGSNSGHVRIYENNNGSWTQLGQDIDGEAYNDYSGYSVSLSSDGNRVAIGAYQNDGNSTNSGHVRIYENNNGSWTQLGQDIDGEASYDQSGYSVSLSSNGETVAIGAPNNYGNGTYSGHVRVYRLDVLKNTSGCDSTAVLDLTILKSDTTISSIISCQSYTWNGQIIDSSGIYTQTFTSINGCDSTHVLDVSIGLPDSVSSTITQCDSIVWNGQLITSSGIYTQTLVNAFGCDSVHTLLAYIISNHNESSSVVSCTGSYDWNGQIIDSNGTYVQTFINAGGCDSTHNLTVSIYNTDSVTSIDSSCNSYNWNGQILDSTGTYTQNLVSSGGCDSIHTLNFTLINNSVDSIYQTINICTGDSYTVGNSVYSVSGIYYDIFTGISGCDSVVETNLIVNDIPLISIDSIAHVGCNGGVSGSIYISLLPGSYTYLWSDGSTSQDLINVLAGSYNLVVTDSIGCSSFSTYNILSNSSSLITSYNVDNVSCFGGSDGQISVLASGGIPPYIVDWPSWTGQTIFNLSAGDYPFTVTDATGCIIYDTVTISEPNELIVDSVMINNVSCNGLNDGFANFSLTGGSVPYTIDWGGVNPFFLSAGSYSVLIIDANGCLITENIIITEPTVLSSSTNIQDISCNNGSDGEIDLTIIGGSSPYNVMWSNGLNTQNISNLSTGLYNVTITDLNGCVLQNAAYVSEPLPIVNNTSIFLCEGDEVVIGNNTISASMGLNGNSTYNLTTADGCDSTLNVLFTVYPTPLVPVIDQIFAATFEVINGPFDNYQWYLNSDSIPGEILSTLNFYQSGIYTVDVSNSYGCVSTSAIFPIGVTSVNENDINEFKVFPNPTKDVLFLNTPTSLGDDCIVELYDLRGKKINNYSMYQQNYRLIIDMSVHSSGAYELIVRYKSGYIWNYKFIKQ